MADREAQPATASETLLETTASPPATPAPMGDGAPSASTPIGHEEPGRYELRRELARGGQGIIYVAWDTHLGREVAFKQLLHRSTHLADGRFSAAEARFLREARITAQLDHPGIAPRHEWGCAPMGRSTRRSAW